MERPKYVWIEDLIVKISILSKLVYMFNTILSKILARFLSKYKQNFEKFK